MCVVREAAAAFVARVPARTFLQSDGLVIRATTVSDQAREVWASRGVGERDAT